jgi:membrane fusion protein (multidrug efflux system)
MNAKAQTLDADVTPEATLDASLDASPGTSTDTPAAGKSLRPKLIMGAIALVAAGYLGHAWWFNQHYVETDNAQIGGDIIPVSSRIAGFVTSVNVKENQIVKAGDLLVTMDDRDTRARLAQAEAELSNVLSSVGRGSQAGQAVAQVQAAQAQSRQAQSAIAQAEADHDNAARELARIKPLLARGLVSTQQVDTADSAERSSAARLQAARDAAQAAEQQVSISNAALRGADARVLAAKAARDLAANQLADTRLVASGGGMVSQKSLEVGQYMQPGQPMMNLVPLDNVWVVANLKETEIGGVRIGSKAEFSIDAYPGVKWQGEVESLSPATGSKFTLLPPDNATGNFTKVVQRIPVRIHVAPGQHSDMPLRPGMSAVTTITRG